jgi:gamma-glutamylcyclotransferase
VIQHPGTTGGYRTCGNICRLLGEPTTFLHGFTDFETVIHRCHMSTTETILYFAYGSNMLSQRLQERAPSAGAVAIGKISGRRLCWHKRSRDGSGKCDADVSENTDDCVWGVIYRVSAHEKPALDIAEGLGSGYAEKTVHVITSQRVMVAITYVATIKDAALLPFDWYKSLVLAGAREHALPPGYVLNLKEVNSAADSDLKRVAQNEAILRAAHSRIPALDDPLKPLIDMMEPDSRQAFFVGSLAERHAE